jgi:hypothetical protein
MERMARRKLLFSLALLVSAQLFAADLPPEMADADKMPNTPRALQLAIDAPWSPTQMTLEIPVADEPQSATLEIPGRTVPNGKLLGLRFRVRMVSEGFGGWNHFLQIRVNGELLGYFSKEGSPRILNRADRSITTSSDRYPKVPYIRSAVGGKPGLLTVFSPQWDAIEPRFVTERDELYWFLLDVSDVIRSDGTNIVEFKNLATAKVFKKTTEEMRAFPMLLDSVELGLLDESTRDTLIENLSVGMAEFRPAVEVFEGGVRLAASEGGAIRIEYNGDVYYGRSSFSEAGEAIRQNRLWWSPTGDWDVRVGARDDKSLIISGKTASYELRRSVTLDGAFIRVRDVIVNRADDDLGVMMRHDLVAGKPGKDWRLSGLPKQPLYSKTAYNPTLHLSGEQTGLGVAVKDSVIRAQMVSSGSRRVVSFANDHFGLAKGSEYAYEWSIHLGGPDFWEFINAVRRDWNVNHTIPGMWGFWYLDDPATVDMNANPDKMRAFLDRKRMQIFAVAPWFEYYYKPRYWQPRSVYKTSVQEQMAAIKAVQPDAKVTACLESFLYYAPESFFKGTLPAFWTDKKGVLDQRGSHKHVLGPAGTKVVDATPWRDSVFRTPDGDVEIDLHYSTRYQDGGVNLKVYPTLDNYWQRKFIDMVDYCINECALDGIYIDSFSYYHNRSYDQWDGHSVDINPATGRIQRKYAQLGLLTRHARREWVKYAADRGKIVYVNGKPATAELQDTPQISFMEAEWNFDPFGEPLQAPSAAQAQLSSPLALGVRAWRYPPHHETKYAEIIHRAVIAYLRHGALYCHYITDIPEPGAPGGGGYGILNHLFPFTPVELHEGWLVGEERIITTVSGTYDWPHAAEPMCLRFDIRGMPVEGGFELNKVEAGWQVRVTLKDWNETAVIGEKSGTEMKARPKEGKIFAPPLSAVLPDDAAALPAFGTITWKTTQLPWVKEGPYAGISGVGMVSCGDAVYVCGGFIPTGDGSEDAASRRTSRWMWRYDPVRGTWTKLPDAPVRREYTRAIAADNRFVLIGGGCQYKKQDPPYRVHGDCALLEFSQQPPVWRKLDALNVPRTHTSVGYVGGHLVVAGGNEYDFGENGYSHRTIRNATEVFNLAHPDKGWQLRAPIPGSSRGWAASISADEKLYLFGGITWNESNEVMATRESLQYDLQEDRWEKRTPPPLGISGWEGALYADRHAILVGGVVHPEPGVSAPVAWSDLAWAYDLHEDEWLRMDGKLPPGAVFNDPGVAIVGDTIYVLGAEGPDGSHFNYFMIGRITPGGQDATEL